MRKYLRVFSMGLQSAMEYRGDFLLGILSVFFGAKVLQLIGDFWYHNYCFIPIAY
ncbi:hypothetical protein [Clostridium saccharoperbutylacetonicum]|uniref:hypothetical protein n=1 Tax=Clostridium saccharoperbutylacetonicum TaxID=36745 RepID=UPI0039ECCCE7